jgi:hypothetical protein
VGAVANSLISGSKGSLITSTGSAVAALPVGTNDHILTADSTAANGIAWKAAPASGIAETLLDAKGDLIVATAADTAARLAVGTNGHALVADSGATAGVKWAGVGKILQVVNTVKTNTFTTTSTSYVDVTDFSASITCSSTSSKVLVFVAVPNLGMSDSNILSLNLLRGATTLTSNTDGGIADTTDAWVVTGGGGMSNDNRKVGSGIIAYLDTPSSTSALTYKCQMRVSGGTGYFNRWANNTDVASVATIILMEVGA